ncbi:MAG TPA: type I phosphomannose isomerase catalytic subunit [Candidatus Acidoferrum sp.]|nr:type I phosphomannose isomerase catalytic subunit [Candidatus Acidoferrum sp.]
MKADPTRIEPTYSERIWGSRSLAPIYPEKSNLAKPIGEAWLTDVECFIATGPFAGKTLGKAWKEMPVSWRGTQLTSISDFPLLVKFIFPKDKLSIQVHPDDTYAATHERAAGGRGKTEMWHVVSAEPGAQLLAGLKTGVTKETFLESLDAHTLEDLFLAHHVQAGETFFIPAGTPHTIGANMIVFEVQEYSDLTYRVYDYGRVDANGKPRELHIEKALEVMKFGNQADIRTISQPLPSHDAFKYLLAACPYFATESWEFEWNFSSESSATHFDLFVILAGSGTLSCQESEQSYKRGECWFIPASLGKFELKPAESTSLIRTYVPHLPSLHQELGIPETKLGKVLFH